ncbi:MAG: KpsF/GutQ family sugar-phosphate isomerase [Candidatus Pacebacteria bacterium]|nr:KpsF/GutQ family sugar-phosphate isomerase [Candidatus Paceibacterota bacterium]
MTHKLPFADQLPLALEAALTLIDRAEQGIAAIRPLIAPSAALSGREFERALALMAALPRGGRVIVSGMGKSGHIGTKIAATLASTGTPAIFVHPAEASHGDLGMITNSDLVIALSNSGNTAELGDLIAYVKRFAIPLIAITRGTDSSLARAADCLLLLPAVAEACPHGLAPTTSTTQTLVMGDALAVAMIEIRRFSSAEFKNLHPGGSLGRHLLTVQDLMHSGNAIPILGGNPTMAEAIVAMTSQKFGCVGLVDGAGRLEGILTDGDLRRHIATDNLLAQPARSLMTENPRTINREALAVEALAVMNGLPREGSIDDGSRKLITALFVVADGKPVGIIHIHDCLRVGLA